VGETRLLPNLASRKGIVIFERSKATADEQFEARNLLPKPAAETSAARAASPFGAWNSASSSIRPPEFLTPRTFFRTSWWSRLGTILSRYPSHLTLVTATVFHDVPLLRPKSSKRQLGLSFLMHGCAFLLLPLLLKYFPFQTTEAAVGPERGQILYYHMARHEDRIRAPRVQQPGPGATPGAGEMPELPPLKGATVSRQALFAVSHPKVPDNNHQTIIQPLSPPELRIKADLKLPNLLLNMPKAPKAPLQFNPNSVKPLEQAKHEVVTVAPNLTPSNVQQPLTDALLATNDNPRLAVPVGSAPAPNLPSRATGSAVDVGAPEIAGIGAPGEGLTVLGTSPGSSSQMVALPPGNRYGDFSIAPGGNGEGVPGGQPGGAPNGGTGDGGSAGANAEGPGNGSFGGGGANSGSDGIINIKGAGETHESLGALSPERVAAMVFALPKIAGPRHNTLLVAAGPMGGGGLNVYGALRCGKIYTVFLPAPGKMWTLQYCESSAAGQAAPPKQVYSSVVHMEESVVPPEAEDRFDFKRTPLPFEKLHKFVILKGRIGEDGKVADLKVYQGLSDEMDAAARQAFSQWTFRPATKGGKAISVDVLVGVPSDPPAGAAKAPIAPAEPAKP